MRRLNIGLACALATLAMPIGPAYEGSVPLIKTRKGDHHGKPGSRSKAERRRRREVRRQRGKQ